MLGLSALFLSVISLSCFDDWWAGQPVDSNDERLEAGWLCGESDAPNGWPAVEPKPWASTFEMLQISSSFLNFTRPPSKNGGQGIVKWTYDYPSLRLDDVLETTTVYHNGTTGIMCINKRDIYDDADCNCFTIGIGPPRPDWMMAGSVNRANVYHDTLGGPEYAGLLSKRSIEGYPDFLYWYSPEGTPLNIQAPSQSFGVSGETLFNRFIAYAPHDGHYPAKVMQPPDHCRPPSGPTDVCEGLDDFVASRDRA